MDAKNIISKFLQDNERPAAWLARKAGLPTSTVLDHAAGRSRPTLSAMQGYCRAGIPEAALVAWDLPEAPDA